jgi:hypothetical protein
MALTRFAHDYTGNDRDTILRELKKLEDKRAAGATGGPHPPPPKEKKPPEEPPVLHP